MNDPQEWIRSYVRYSSIILQLVLTIVGGVFLGYKMDQWLRTKPFFLISFTIIFSILSFYRAVRELLRKK
jgi:F0F1-type ATP synthase assembly protein I